MSGPRGESDKFCLRWNDFESNLSAAFQEVREENSLYDVTVACDGGGEFPAHRLVLAACSQVLRQVICRKSQLGGNQQQQVIYLRGVNSRDLKFILSFMYQGEVSIAQDHLNSFLAVAEDLQVKGLTQERNCRDASKQTSHTKMRDLKDIGLMPSDDDNEEIPSTADRIKVESNPKKLAGPNPGQVTSFHESREMVDYENGAGDNIYDDYGGHYGEPGPTQCYAGSNLNNDNNSGNNQDLWSVRFIVDIFIFLVWSISSGLNPEGLFERRPEGDFICIQCGYTNKWKHNMQKHTETHIEGPGHQCKYCFRNFKTKNSLQSHESMKHREEKHNSL